MSTRLREGLKMEDKDSQESKKPTEPQLHVVIVTDDRTVYDSIAERLIAPAINGRVTILLHHAPFLAQLEPGELVVRAEEHEESIAIGGGFLEVRDNQAIVLADTAERAEEIDVARAEAARRRATLLVKEYRGRPEFVETWRALRRSRARLRVAQKVGQRASRRS